MHTEIYLRLNALVNDILVKWISLVNDIHLTRISLTNASITLVLLGVPPLSLALDLRRLAFLVGLRECSFSPASDLFYWFGESEVIAICKCYEICASLRPSAWTQTFALTINHWFVDWFYQFSLFQFISLCYVLVCVYTYLLHIMCIMLCLVLCTWGCI